MEIMEMLAREVPRMLTVNVVDLACLCFLICQILARPWTWHVIWSAMGLSEILWHLSAKTSCRRLHPRILPRRLHHPLVLAGLLLRSQCALHLLLAHPAQISKKAVYLCVDRAIINLLFAGLQHWALRWEKLIDVAGSLLGQQLVELVRVGPVFVCQIHGVDRADVAVLLREAHRGVVQMLVHLVLVVVRFAFMGYSRLPGDGVDGPLLHDCLVPVAQAQFLGGG